MNFWMIALFVIFVLFLLLISKMPDQLTKIFLVATWAIGAIAVISAIVKAVFFRGA